MKRAITCFTLVLATANVIAAEPFYIGTWKIDSATVAPWWTEREAPDPGEKKALVGRTFSIGAKSITGPPQLACGNPHYVVKDYAADMLFQGAFGEMHEREKSVDPATAAAAAGFRGSTWKTLETGCGNEIDFHFIDSSTAAFGLNNYIYRVSRQR
ncbi:MAG TPA: hypothetical protein VFA04_13115 [Bryobacteraceae bacterium]|nr:hypothetical protein [Bryobacteraceae bacterium]